MNDEEIIQKIIEESDDKHLKELGKSVVRLAIKIAKAEVKEDG